MITKSAIQLELNELKSEVYTENSTLADCLIPVYHKERSRERAIKLVWMHLQNDWTLKSETPEYFLLTKTKASLKEHFIIAIILGWWTIFIPNLIYHLVVQRKKKIYK